MDLKILLYRSTYRRYAIDLEQKNLFFLSLCLGFSSPTLEEAQYVFEEARYVYVKESEVIDTFQMFFFLAF
jgi:hypothetical protein